MIWPKLDASDPNSGHWLDLSEPGLNNHYWRDFIRAYRFSIPVEAAAAAESYVLEVTCMVHPNRRLTTETALRRK